MELFVVPLIRINQSIDVTLPTPRRLTLARLLAALQVVSAFETRLIVLGMGVGVLLDRIIRLIESRGHHRRDQEASGAQSMNTETRHRHSHPTVLPTRTLPV